MTEVTKDSWATPQWLYNWLNSTYNFDVDLCASEENAKHFVFVDEKEDSLSIRWHGNNTNYARVGFCNPPYSKIAPWVEKAVLESKKMFTTVMVIPTPNGEKYYEDIFKNASSITYITGRIAFVAPFDYTVKGKKGKDGKKDTPDKFIKKGDEVSGNTRGTCVVEFSKSYKYSKPEIYHVVRDELIHRFSSLKFSGIC